MYKYNNTMRRLGNKISEEGLHLYLPAVLEELSKQDCNNGCFVPTGEIAFELITDNNFILKDNLLTFTKDLDVGFYSQSKTDVREKMKELLERFKSNSYYPMISIAILINNMLIEAEADDPRLTSCRIGLDDINTTLEIDERSSKLNPIQLFSIVLKIKELKIQLLECGDEFHKMEGLANLPNGLKCISRQSLLREIKEDLIPDKTRLGQHDKLEKYKKRTTILEKSASPIPLLDMEVFDFTYHGNKAIDALLIESKNIIDEHDPKSIQKYSGASYGNINEYLLLKNLFSEDFDDLKYSKSREDIENIEKIIKVPKTEQKEDFVLYRFTQPSIYDKKVIDIYNVGDLIKIPTFISATFNPTEAVTSRDSSIFVNNFTPLVIFKIIVKPSNYSNLLFVESHAVASQHEVLLLYNTVFKVLDKKFVLIDFNGTKVQKLLFVLELSKDYNKEYTSQETTTEVLQTIPNLSQYLSLPDPKIPSLDYSLNHIIDKLSKEDDKNYKNNKTIILKNSVITHLLTAISAIEKEKNDTMQMIANKIKEYEQDRSNKSEHYRTRINEIHKKIADNESKIKNLTESARSNLEEQVRQGNELIKKYNADRSEKENTNKKLIEDLRKESIDNEARIKSDNGKLLTDIEMENTTLLDSIKTYESNMKKELEKYSKELNNSKKELENVEELLKTADASAVHDLNKTKNIYLESISIHEELIKNTEKDTNKYIKDYSNQIEKNNKKIQELKDKLPDEIKRNQDRINNDIKRIEGYIKDDDRFHKISVDNVKSKILKAEKDLKETLKGNIEMIERENESHKGLITHEEVMIKMNNEHFDSMMKHNREHNFSNENSKLKSFAKILQNLNKIDVSDLKSIVKRFEVHGSAEVKTMLIQDIYQNNILSYAVPYLLRNDAGYKLKNNIGMFTYIDKSIKLFDKDNVLRLTYPKIDKQVIYKNILDNPSRYFDLEYINKHTEVIPKDTYPQMGPTLPVLAAGIGFMKMNPLIVIIIILVIIVIFMIYRMGMQSNYTRKPKKGKHQ